MAPPTDLTATVTPSGRVALAWTDNSPNEGEFQIERRAGGRFVRIATVAAGLTTFEDRGVAPGRSYTYRVRAVDGASASAYSDEATATITAPVSW